MLNIRRLSADVAMHVVYVFFRQEEAKKWEPRMKRRSSRRDQAQGRHDVM